MLGEWGGHANIFTASQAVKYLASWQVSWQISTAQSSDSWGPRQYLYSKHLIHFEYDYKSIEHVWS